MNKLILNTGVQDFINEKINADIMSVLLKKPIFKGISQKELAEQLFISENTLKTHLTSIRHKLGVSGRADIAERATELNLI